MNERLKSDSARKEIVAIPLELISAQTGVTNRGYRHTVGLLWGPSLGGCMVSDLAICEAV